MSNTHPSASFFLIVADHDRGVFCIEGPMPDNRPWKEAAMNARNHGRRIECGPASPDRDTLAADYRHAIIERTEIIGDVRASVVPALIAASADRASLRSSNSLPQIFATRTRAALTAVPWPTSSPGARIMAFRP